MIECLPLVAAGTVGADEISEDDSAIKTKPEDGGKNGPPMEERNADRRKRTQIGGGRR